MAAFVSQVARDVVFVVVGAPVHNVCGVVVAGQNLQFEALGKKAEVLFYGEVGKQCALQGGGIAAGGHLGQRVVKVLCLYPADVVAYGSGDGRGVEQGRKRRPFGSGARERLLILEQAAAQPYLNQCGRGQLDIQI